MPTDKEAFELLVESVVATIRECQVDGPVPETPIFLVLQEVFPKVFPDVNEFNVLINFLVKSGKIKRNNNHTLEVI